MVWVPAGDARVIDGPIVSIEGFWIDRLEVTNREYQAFVDAGGYRSPRYWTEPFFSNGRRLSRKWADLVEVGGARADRGHLLPRGYTRVEGIERV